MATSVKIKVEGLKGVALYKHWDGYPTATLPWLEAFNENFTAARGDDPNYKFAQLIRSSAFDSEVFNLDYDRILGWGVITDKEEWNCRYIYTLHRDGTVSYRKK